MRKKKKKLDGNHRHFIGARNFSRPCAGVSSPLLSDEKLSIYGFCFRSDGTQPEASNHSAYYLFRAVEEERILWYGGTEMQHLNTSQRAQ